MNTKEKNPALAIVLTSVTVSAIIFSLFLHAGAVTITNNQARMPYKLNATSKYYSGNYITTSFHGNDFCAQHYSTDPNDSCSYYNHGSDVGSRGVLNDGSLVEGYKGQWVCYSTWVPPFVTCQYIRATDMLGGTPRIAHDYAATCPSGQVMTGFSWGGYWQDDWGKRYAMIPECAPLTLLHG